MTVECDSFHWDFGDGSTSNEENPVHTYLKAGTFNVRLILYSKKSEGIISTEQKIKVLPERKLPRSSAKVDLSSDTRSIAKQIDTTPVTFQLPACFNGKHLGGDSLQLFFQNRDNDADSIIVWYGRDSVPQFNDSLHTRKIDPGFFDIDPDSDSIQILIRDTMFLENTRPVTIAFVLKKQDRFSDTLIESIVLLRNSKKTHEKDTCKVIINNVSLNKEKALLIIHFSTQPPHEKEKIRITLSNINDPNKREHVFTYPARDSVEMNLNLLKPREVYTVTLQVLGSSGIWSDVSESNQFIMKIPEIDSQIVRFSKGDTVRLFHDAFFVYDNASSVDTNRYGTVLRKNRTEFSGAIVVSDEFTLTLPESSDPYIFGISLDTIHSPLKNVRVFRKEQSLLHVEPSYVVDNDRSVIWVKTKARSATFAALIDTVAPTATIISDTAEIVIPGIGYSDTLVLNDNAATVKWTFRLLKRANEGLEYTEESGNCLSSDTLICTVPDDPAIVSEMQGVVAYLDIDDGSNISTINLSRRVMRSESDETTIYPRKWVPVKTTSYLNASAIEYALLDLCDQDKWGYDPKQFRLYSWQSHKNGAPVNKWIEYASANTRQFNLKPGSVIWVKTRNQHTLNLGPGITPSLKDTFRISLKPRTWTDFALPFSFPVALKSILSASTSSDSLQIYAWNHDSSTVPYLIPLHLPHFYSTDTVLNNYQVYRVFNGASNDKQLRIPPSPSLGSQNTTNPKTDRNVWLFRVSARNSHQEVLGEVLYGVADSTDNYSYPAPFSMSWQQITVQETTGMQTGHLLCSKDKGDGHAFEINFVNRSDKTDTIIFDIRCENNSDSSLSLSVCDPQSGTPITDNRVIINPGQKRSIKCIAGSDSYIKRFYAVQYPSKPIILGIGVIESEMVFRYMLPGDELKRVSYSIISHQGETIWSRSVVETQSGVQEQRWNYLADNYSHAPAGFYIFKITASDMDDNQWDVYRQFWYHP